MRLEYLLWTTRSGYCKIAMSLCTGLELKLIAKRDCNHHLTSDWFAKTASKAASGLFNSLRFRYMAQHFCQALVLVTTFVISFFFNRRVNVFFFFFLVYFLNFERSAMRVAYALKATFLFLILT